MKINLTRPEKRKDSEISSQRILEILSIRSYTDVGRLYQDYCEIEQSSVSKTLFASEIKELEAEGQVELLGPVVEVRSVSQYLRNLDESLWFHFAIITAALTFLLALYDNLYPWEIARWVFGSIEATVSVGYVTLKAIFPKKEEFDSIEMIALAVATSISVSALLALLVDISPFGLTELPVLTALTLYSFAVSFAALGVNYRWRRRNIASRPRKEEQ